MFFVSMQLASTGFARLPVVVGLGPTGTFAAVLNVAFVAVLLIHNVRAYDGWRRWVIGGCFGYRPRIPLAFAVLVPTVFSSAAWLGLVGRLGGR